MPKKWPQSIGSKSTPSEPYLGSQTVITIKIPLGTEHPKEVFGPIFFSLMTEAPPLPNQPPSTPQRLKLWGLDHFLFGEGEEPLPEGGAPAEKSFTPDASAPGGADDEQPDADEDGQGTSCCMGAGSGEGLLDGALKADEMIYHTPREEEDDPSALSVPMTAIPGMITMRREEVSAKVDNAIRRQAVATTVMGKDRLADDGVYEVKGGGTPGSSWP